jgi:hypothetical protein
MIPVQDRDLRQRKCIRKAVLLEHVTDSGSKIGIVGTGSGFDHQIPPVNAGRSRPA